MRDVWHETQAALDHLQQSLETVEGMERAVMVAQCSEMLHDGVKELMELMQTGVERMRLQVHAADAQLAAAAETLIMQSALQHNNHWPRTPAGNA